jgi:hypothetical protein
MQTSSATIRRSIAAFALACAALAAPALAQVPPGGVPIPSPADFGDPDDRFGTEIDLYGEWAVATGLSREAIYVYQRVDGLWTRRQRIVPPTLGQAGPASLDLRGNRLLIARAFGESFAGEGRVFVYERSAPGAAFAIVATVAPDAGQGGDRFGYGLAQSADRIFVGASGRDETTGDQGAVYVFRRDAGNWVQEQKLVMPDPTVADRFGFALDFDGQDLLVGARQHRPTPATPSRRGAVYVYRLQAASWTQVQKLEQPPAVTQGTQFGYDVSATNGRAAITAPGGGVAAVYLAERDAGGVWSYTPLPPPLAGTGRFPGFLGQIDLDGDLVAVPVQSALDAGLAQPAPTYAVVWRRDAGTWSVTAQLQRPDGNGGDAGTTRLSAGWLLAGAPSDDASANNVDQGSILSFSLVNGVATPRQRLWHGNGNVPDYLGFGVGIDGDHAVTIAPGADPAGAGTDRGAVHFLRRAPAGGWSFVQTIAGTADSGLPFAVGIAGDLAYVSLPGNLAAGLPAPTFRVYQRDAGGTWAALCDLPLPAGTTTPANNILRASPLGVLALVDGNRVAFWPAPTGPACSAGSLLPAAPNGGSYLGVQLTGSVAALQWFASINGATRPGVDVLEFSGGSWTLAQRFAGSAINGLVAEGFENGLSDGANRVLLTHVVPVSTIDRRFDIELWQRPAPGSAFVLARTFTSPTPTNGYQGALFAGPAVLLNAPAIGPNGGLAVVDPASGARLQDLVPPGLAIDDEGLNAVAASGDRAIVGWRNKNRSGVNHAGMVYLIEPLAPRGGLPAFGTLQPQAVPPPGADALFFDGLEIPAY